MPPIFLSDPQVWVICLCADWCGVCRDYRAVMEGMAKNNPAFQFAWIDIEDHAELAGDVDIETFPTILVADKQGVLFFGPLTPQAPTLKRLLESLEEPSAKRQAHTAITRSLVDALPAHPELHIRT